MESRTHELIRRLYALLHGASTRHAEHRALRLIQCAISHAVVILVCLSPDGQILEEMATDPPTDAPISERRKLPAPMGYPLGDYALEPGQPRIISAAAPSSTVKDATFTDKLLDPSNFGAHLTAGYVDPYTRLTYMLTFESRQAPDDQAIRADRVVAEQLLPHLAGFMNQAFFIRARNTKAFAIDLPTALCTDAGRICYVHPDFIILLRQYFPDWNSPYLPFSLQPGQSGNTRQINDLKVVYRPHHDHYLVQIIEQNPDLLLSEREHQVAILTKDGLANKQIARQLNIAPSTVANHLGRIYQKLAVHSRAELAALMKRQRIPEQNGAHAIMRS